jgi:hypothetical protein
MDKGEYESPRSVGYEKTLGKRPAQESPKFDEAPGEEEANAVRDAFLNNVSKQPAATPQALSTVDSSTRASAVNRLQQQQGNTYVKRVVADTQGKPGRLVGLSQNDMVNEVQQRKGSGSELPGETRKTMEGQFGADLSGVRVHSGGESVALNRELNAQAFTVGSDIFMGEGKYNPGSSEGQGLLAHELTHVGQQTGFGSSGVQREGVAEEDEEKVSRQAEDEDQEEKT